MRERREGEVGGARRGAERRERKGGNGRKEESWKRK